MAPSLGQHLVCKCAVVFRLSPATLLANVEQLPPQKLMSEDKVCTPTYSVLPFSSCGTLRKGSRGPRQKPEMEFCISMNLLMLVNK